MVFLCFEVLHLGFGFQLTRFGFQLHPSEWLCSGGKVSRRVTVGHCPGSIDPCESVAQDQ